MRNVYAIFIILLLLSYSLKAQPSIQWQNTIGGNLNDLLQSVDLTTDGGYIAGGHSYSSITGDKTEDTIGGFDYWIIKTNAGGAMLWQNTIGGTANDYLSAVQHTSDNGYIIGGYSESGISGDKTENNEGASDYWVLKLDSLGNIQWQNTIGGDSSDYLYSIQQTTDGGYILGGASNSSASGDKTDSSFGYYDFWIVKLNSSGVITWQKTIGGNGSDWLRSVKETSDGGYFAAGYSDSDSSGEKTENSMGLFDYWIVKLDNSGNIQWQNTMGGGDFDFLYSAEQTFDEGFILGGNSFSSVSADKSENVIGFDDYWVIKVDSLGIIEWENTIGGTASDQVRSIVQAADSGYVIGGLSNSDISADKSENSLGSFDYWVIKTDTIGNITWQNTIGGSGSDQLTSLQITTDQGYILGGYSMSGISGDKTESGQGFFDYWLVKLNNDSITGIIPLFISRVEQQLTVYPNPASQSVSIRSAHMLTGNTRLIIYDLKGNKITEPLMRNNEEIKLDISALSNGMYVIQLLTDEGKFSARFVKN